MKIVQYTSPIALLTAAILLTACGGSSSSSGDAADDGEDNTPAETYSYLALDATNPAAATTVELSSGHTVTDESWQIGYQKYVGFSVNGGHSGSGAVEGCIAHQYEAIFDADGNPVITEFEALTRDSTEANFETVNKASCAEMTSDTLKTEIKVEDWLDADYSTGAPVFSAKEGNGWIIRSSSKDAASDQYNYARIQVKDVNVVFGAATTRKVTLSVENWDASTSTFSAAVDSPELDFSDNRTFYDMETNTIATESDNWDLSIIVSGRDYLIQVNGGASGTGSGGTGVLIVASVDDVTDPTDTAQVYKYFGDSVEGILSTPGNYGPFQYSVKGEHKMWPTFTTYLFKDGESYYKAQLVSNYGEDGTLASGNLYIRYEEVVD